MKGMRSNVWSAETLTRGVGKSSQQPSKMLDPSPIGDDADLAKVPCHNFEYIYIYNIFLYKNIFIIYIYIN